MRVDINLASRKYEDVRRFFVRWSVALTALTALLILLATLAGLSYSRSARSGRHIKELQQEIAQLEKERARLMNIENRPENRDLTEQKRFWNGQIVQRKFSWTQLLNDLQKIMPNRANLVSVQPELTPDHRVMLSLVIEAENRNNARELLQRMEGSERFRTSKILEEVAEPKEAKAGTPSVKFKIQGEYLPASTAPSSQPARSSSREGI